MLEGMSVGGVLPWATRTAVTSVKQLHARHSPHCSMPKHGEPPSSNPSIVGKSHPRLAPAHSHALHRHTELLSHPTSSPRHILHHATGSAQPIGEASRSQEGGSRIGGDGSGEWATAQVMVETASLPSLGLGLEGKKRRGSTSSVIAATWASTSLLWRARQGRGRNEAGGGGGGWARRYRPGGTTLGTWKSSCASC